MKKSTAVALILAILLLLGGGVASWSWRQAAGREVESMVPPAAVRTSHSDTTERIAALRSAILPAPVDDRLARANKIRRDYDDMTAKITADYSAAGTTFPGGLGAYLRQLALLKREKHKDLATLLTPRELEDLEMGDTNAGQTVQKFLGDTTATDEQRREVFRLQKAFEDEFDLTFDLTPVVLAAGESQRQAMQQKIHAVLGDDLFGTWLAGEGPDYAAFTAFAQQQGLAATAPLELWQAKNDFTLAQLQLRARTDLTPEQLAGAESELANQTLARVTGLMGATAVSGPGREVLGWLLQPPAK